MAKIEFLGPIGRPSVEADVNSLAELKEYFKDDEELSKWLGICAVAINDNLVCELDAPIKEGDRVSLLPPVCGG